MTAPAAPAAADGGRRSGAPMARHPRAGHPGARGPRGRHPVPSIALPDMAAFEVEETVPSIEVPVLDDSPAEVPLARIPA